MPTSIFKKLNGNFHGQNILSSEQFSRNDIDIVIKATDKIKKIVKKNGSCDILKGKIMSALFYEPSSRTFGSFVAGMQKLGGGFIPFQNMDNSSAAKGESLKDTIQVFASYSDIIVMRHPEIGSMEIANEATDIPIINAGEGIGEHPTQALYDIYTIKEAFKKLDNLHIVFFGELGHYRPVNSLVKLLALYPVKISFISPPEGKLNPKIKKYLVENNVSFTEGSDIAPVINNADVLYVTRIKKEFMPSQLYKKLQGRYQLNKNLVSQMKKKNIIMHALPRTDEINPEVDEDPRAVYLKSQVKNGMLVRMALLALVLGKI